MHAIFFKGRKSPTNKQTNLHPFKKIGFRYVESIENRSKRFYYFSFEFLMETIQKSGGNHSNN